MEVLNPTIGQSCLLPSLPDKRSYHTSAGLEICGGYDTRTSCITFSSSGEWVTSHTLLEKRHHHVSWDTEEGTIIMGGEYSLTTTEIVRKGEDSVPGFYLEYRTEY